MDTTYHSQLSGEERHPPRAVLHPALMTTSVRVPANVRVLGTGGAYSVPPEELCSLPFELEPGASDSRKTEGTVGIWSWDFLDKCLSFPLTWPSVVRSNSSLSMGSWLLPRHNSARVLNCVVSWRSGALCVGVWLGSGSRRRCFLPGCLGALASLNVL